jgi:hypothetical protein
VKLRIWWIPQLGVKAFYVAVESVAEGVKLLRVLADYDQFQLDNRVKGDYCNTGGLQMFDESDDTDTPNGSWVDWCDEETGEDDPAAWLELQKELANG